jgi:hypothetical protein
LVCFQTLLVYFQTLWVCFPTIWYLHSAVIWYIFPVLACCIKKNLATLATTRKQGFRQDCGREFFKELGPVHTYIEFFFSCKVNVI